MENDGMLMVLMQIIKIIFIKYSQLFKFTLIKNNNIKL